MKKIINYLIFILFSALAISIFTLSTIGIETNKFNKLISEEIKQTKNVNLELKTIKFKLDPRKLSLFLETESPKIIYKNIFIPIKNIRIYIDFSSLLKTEPKIKKTNIIFDELNINQIKKFSSIIKPSNFKSLLNNNIKEGTIFSEVEIFLNDKGLLEDFIAKGSVKDMKAVIFKNIDISKTNLNFFADKKDVLIKNVFGDIDSVKILDGDIKLNLDSGIKLNSNFNSKIDIDEKFVDKHFKSLNELNLGKTIKSLKADLNNNFFIEFDKTYKIKSYNYDISGKIEKGILELNNPLRSNFIQDSIKEIFISNVEIQSNFSPNKIKTNGEGKYSFNNFDYSQISVENQIDNDQLKLKLNFNYTGNLGIDLINYEKPKNSIAKIFLDLKRKNDSFKINKFKLEEGKNTIGIDGLTFKKNNFSSFKKISVKTKHNDFLIQNKKKILIKGTKFDAANLLKFLDGEVNENKFKNFNSEIEIDLETIKVPMSEKLKNFKLLGEIEKGKFVKITSKGDFGGDNFLDISMKKDKNSEKKYLEIYSDLTRPLLSEYSFFKGLSGGKLLYTSIIDGTKSNSKLKIENFKLVNAPAVVKLLSLADLGGLADLAEGEGLSFDLLEIDIEKNENILRLNEILALGPSISVLMDGYQDKNGLTSLRGTLVPAKTLNKLISKIPIIGNIIIPKEIGEGLFGVSFKMKGPKGKIKTTINPIRTLTPRFIQKIIDKNKKPR